MSTANLSLTIAGLEIEIVYKAIKNMHISVYPPDGRIRVAAPSSTNEDTIRLAIVQRLPWIKRQRERLQSAERQTQREMVSGETHYVWGKRYRLEVANSTGRYRIETTGQTLRLITPSGIDADKKRTALDRWYRRELKAAIPDLLAKWQPIIGVEADKVVVRRMKTKWGTCQTASRAIWLNPELAKKNPRCLEYIVVHELTHFLERSHNQRFTDLMDKFLPDWQARRDELNSAPLAEEDWI